MFLDMLLLARMWLLHYPVHCLCINFIEMLLTAGPLAMCR